MASTYTDKKTDEELEQLKALVAEQQERLDALEGHGDASLKADSKEQRATRRQMLKLAGAALAGAAGSAALRAVPAPQTPCAALRTDCLRPLITTSLLVLQTVLHFGQ